MVRLPLAKGSELVTLRMTCKHPGALGGETPSIGYKGVCQVERLRRQDQAGCRSPGSLKFLNWAAKGELLLFGRHQPLAQDLVVVSEDLWLDF